jgi:hypothetical protein
MKSTSTMVIQFHEFSSSLTRRIVSSSVPEADEAPVGPFVGRSERVSKIVGRCVTVGPNIRLATRSSSCCIVVPISPLPRSSNGPPRVAHC